MSDEHNEYQRRYYTERDSPRIGLDRSGTPYVRRHVTEVLAALDRPTGSSILDVGCGLGKYTVGLMEAGYVVEGIDLTPALIESLHGQIPELPLHVGDVAVPPEALHGRFSGVVGFFFLHHVDDLAAVFAGVRRCLTPGGRAVFIEPNPLFLGFYAQIAITPGMTWRGERGILSMRPKVLAEAARRAGFTRCRSTAFGAFPPVLANRTRGARIEQIIEHLPGWDRVGAFRLITVE